MILSDFGVTGTNPSVISMAGTSSFQLTNPKYFPRPSANLTVPRVLDPQTGSLVIATTPNATNATGQLNYNGPSGQNLLNGQMVRIRAVGNISTIINTTAIITLQANTGSLSSPSYVTIAGTQAFTVPGNGNNGALPPVARCWSIEAVVSGDSASGIVQGQYSAIVQTNANLSAYLNIAGSNPWVILANVIPNVGTINLNPVAGQAGVNMVPFGLVVSVTFGTGNVTNTANLFQFAILDI
jgi:hypothetical protein